MEKLVSLEILKTYHDKAVVPLLQKLYSIEELNKEIPSLLKTTNEEVVSGNVPIYDGASGLLIKDSGFSIKSSVPSNALFTDKYKDANASVDEVNYLVGATSNIQNQITQIKDDLSGCDTAINEVKQNLQNHLIIKTQNFGGWSGAATSASMSTPNGYTFASCSVINDSGANCISSYEVSTQNLRIRSTNASQAVFAAGIAVVVVFVKN